MPSLLNMNFYTYCIRASYFFALLPELIRQVRPTSPLTLPQYTKRFHCIRYQTNPLATLSEMSPALINAFLSIYPSPSWSVSPPCSTFSYITVCLHDQPVISHMLNMAISSKGLIQMPFSDDFFTRHIFLIFVRYSIFLILIILHKLPISTTLISSPS